MAIPPRQTPVAHAPVRAAQWLDTRIEHWLEAERDQLPLWLPVALGAGIAGWFVLPDRGGWIALIAAGLGAALAGLALGPVRRSARLLLVGGLALALGCGLVWARATWLAAPVLKRPVLASFEATVERVQLLPDRDVVRAVLRPTPGRVAVPDPSSPLTLSPSKGERGSAGAGGLRQAQPERSRETFALPPRIRVNIAEADAPPRLAGGDRVRLRARLMPPAEPALPGGYDFALAAWFQQLGATGRALGPVERLGEGGIGQGLRDRLSAQVRAALPAAEAGIAVALATGDQGSVADADAEALRRSGLAHLLSVSGLHISAAVGAAVLFTLHLLALSPRLALAWSLPLVAAGAGAVAGIFYTWLSGAEVPTIRACIAALLVLGGLALGREAITLRLVAVGALVVLLFWPETLIGPSFQLSFAAVTAIIALHEHPRMRALFARRDEGVAMRIGRFLLSLLLSGLVVELALAPIALFHFHKQGVYGALANIVAIPLTTFVVMPLEVLALLLDTVGLGAPVWWLAGKTIAALLWIARAAADAPGSVAMLPTMDRGAFALMLAGGLGVCLLRTPARWAGLAPFAAGALWAGATPAPDLLVTGDGKHLAVRGPDGGYALLRPRAKDYVRGLLGEAAGTDAALAELDALPRAACGPDACAATVERDGRRLAVLATRSPYPLPWRDLVRACARADIVVSDRRLPRGCAPRWLKLDRAMLARTGGVTIRLGDPPTVATVGAGRGRHPWVKGMAE